MSCLCSLKKQKFQNTQIEDITKEYSKRKCNNNNKNIFIIDLDLLEGESTNIISNLLGPKITNGNFKNIALIVNTLLLYDEPIEEIIINICSPGGSIIDFYYVYDQLKRLKDHKYKIIIFIKKVAASGGYLLSCIGDKIYSSNDAIIGSIGVYRQTFDVSELIDFLKIGYKKYKAGEFKAMGDIFEKPDEKADKKMQEETIIQHERFKKSIIKYRPQIEIDKVSTAEIWPGDEALKLKLVDEIGNVDDYLLNISNKYNIKKIYYKKEVKSSGITSWIIKKIFT